VANRWTQAATILPPTIEVCGRRLLPFCLRHRVALEAIESPILTTDKPFGATDIINAVRILSTHNIEEMRSKPSFREGYYFQKMRISKRILKTEAYKLLVYFNEQSLWPRFWQKESKSSSDDKGFPWELSIVACLVRNGHTTEEAWTMPESAAIWLHMAHVRASGSDVQIVSDKEWQAMEDCKKREAFKAAA
jgi:hypothetical protein